jgi:hypothetical protein
MSEKRIRSPNYPAISLPSAIERISALYKNQHSHAAPREVVANSLGFRSLSGPAATVISTLFKYGLLERVGSEAKISERALQILFPNSPAERDGAIRAAADEPQLFAELNERFPGGGSDALLRNYLTRRNFSPNALDDVILAFKETAEFVSREVGGHDSPAPTEERAMVRSTETAAITPPMSPIQGTEGEPYQFWHSPGHLRGSFDITDEESADQVLRAVEAWVQAWKLLQQPTDTVRRPIASGSEDEKDEGGV